MDIVTTMGISANQRKMQANVHAEDTITNGTAFGDVMSSVADPEDSNEQHQQFNRESAIYAANETEYNTTTGEETYMMNVVVPTANNVPTIQQASTPTNVTDEKKAGIAADFRGVLNTATNVKLVNGKIGELTDNSAIAALAGKIVDTLNLNTVSGETQNAETIQKDILNISDDSTDSVLNAQVLEAVMALFGAQPPVLAQNPIASSAKGNAAMVGVTDAVGAVKADSFAALQEKVLSVIKTELNTNDNTSSAIISEKQDLPTAQTTGTPIIKTDDISVVQPELNVIKVQVVNQANNILTAAPGEQAGKEVLSAVTKGEKDNVAVSAVQVAEQPIQKITTFGAAKEKTIEVIPSLTDETAQGEVSLLLKNETSNDENKESTADDNEQSAAFGNVLGQSINKAQTAHGAFREVPKAHDAYNVAGQIVEQAKLFKQPVDANNSEMLIKLRPDHLGELTLKVAVENGVVSASFHTNNAEVRSIIEASLPQLKQDLSNQGLKVDNVDVYAGLGDFFSDSQSQQGELFRQQQQQQQQSSKLNNLKSTDDFVQAVEETAAGTPVVGADGVDYRV